MAMVILVATTGFTMNAHFCAGELQHIAFLGQAESCEMHTKQLPPCQHEQESHSQIEKKSCCEDMSVISDQQDSLAGSIVPKIFKPDFKFIAVVSSFFLAAIAEYTPHFSKYHQYSPPLIERDIPVLVQSFLI
jgi:hypothetical protein